MNCKYGNPGKIYGMYFGIGATDIKAVTSLLKMIRKQTNKQKLFIQVLITDIEREPSTLSPCEEPSSAPGPMALCEETRHLLLTLLQETVWLNAAAVVLPKLSLRILKYFDQNVSFMFY